MTTFNRLDYLATRDERASARPSGPTVEQVLNRHGVILFRIRSAYDARGIRWHELRAYTDRFDAIEFDYADATADAEIRLGLLRLMFEQYTTIDWRVDHDVDVLTGEVRRSPRDNEAGWLPELDATFGGSAPVYLPRLADWADAPATTFPTPVQVGA